MFRRALPLVLASLATPSFGAGASCDPDEMSCSPLVACVEATGEIFRGASYGPDAGTLIAESTTGARCYGSWRRTTLGVGLAEFACSDGRVGRSAFTWFEFETGTAVGEGRFDDGTVVRFWSGNNLERYFREVDPAEVERMACAPDDMLLS